MHVHSKAGTVAATRRRRRLVAPTAAVLALSLGLAACGDTDDDEEAATTTEATEEPTTTTEAEAQAVEIVGVDYSFDSAPASLSAGVVELSFENQGEVGHEAALVEIGDTPLEQFLTEFPPVLEGGPFPAYSEHIAAPGEADPGETTEVTFTVSEGTYALICTLDGDAEAAPAEGAEEGEEPTGPAHFTRGMAQVLEVGPGDENPTLPEADGAITSIDYGFEIDISDGDQAINFVNEGPEEVHVAAISVFPEGTDEAAAEAAFQTLLESGQDAPPPEGVPLPEDVAFSGIFSTGLGATFETSEPFESGRTYIATCFIQDRAGGPPHAISHQMYQVFTVE